jgi:hypothetical protein
MPFCKSELRPCVAVTTLALLALGCSAGEEPAVHRSPGVMSSEEAASGVEAHSTVVVNSTVFKSNASLQLNTYQRDGVVVRSLGFHTTLDSFETWFSLSPFPDGTTEVLMPDAAAGALSENGESWSFATGAATVTHDGENWAVRIAGTGVAADQSTTQLSIDVSGKLERQCFVPDDSEAPHAVSQDGRESDNALVLDPEWSTPFCQSQLQ